MNRTIYWDKQALHVFVRSVARIGRKSTLHAAQAEADILSKISQLNVEPVLHAPDQYKRDNDGGYRAFELHRHRISYFANDTAIIILRIMHVRRRS